MYYDLLDVAAAGKNVADFNTYTDVIKSWMVKTNKNTNSVVEWLWLKFIQKGTHFNTNAFNKKFQFNNKKYTLYKLWEYFEENNYLQDPYLFGFLEYTKYPEMGNWAPKGSYTFDFIEHGSVNRRLIYDLNKYYLKFTCKFNSFVDPFLLFKDILSVFMAGILNPSEPTSIIVITNRCAEDILDFNIIFFSKAHLDDFIINTNFDHIKGVSQLTILEFSYLIKEDSWLGLFYRLIFHNFFIPSDNCFSISYTSPYLLKEIKSLNSVPLYRALSYFGAYLHAELNEQMYTIDFFPDKLEELKKLNIISSITKGGRSLVTFNNFSLLDYSGLPDYEEFKYVKSLIP